MSPGTVVTFGPLTGDITRPMFGLAERAYAELAARVDAVIHCAAATGFNRTDVRPNWLGEPDDDRCDRLCLL